MDDFARATFATTSGSRSRPRRARQALIADAHDDLGFLPIGAEVLPLRHRLAFDGPAGPVVRSPPVPSPSASPGRRSETLGGLRASGWSSRTVKEELRTNLLARLAEDRPIVSGIIGYDESVLPAIENAIVAGHDLVLLGERGQAKTRLARLLIGLLDDAIPVVRGGELNDDPTAPISPSGRTIVAEHGDATPIDWLPRDRRYAEKLATPDITIADLIGEVDPIRVAEGRYLNDELTLHYGLIPRSNRGIFAINELPDLAERIQVGLLNILEERDVQIRGFTVRLPLDLFVIASANPEDYTSRGRIITPLKDRLGSQVRTHYPRTLDHELAIVRQEKQRFVGGEGEPVIAVPAFMEELLAELTHLARRSPEISQRSGVSVRVTVANAEVLEAASLRRAVRLGETVAAPRVSDLGAVVASTVGKIELESVGDDAPEERIVERLITKALFATFGRIVDIDELDEVVLAFEEGLVIETGERVPSRDYVRWMTEIPGLHEAVRRLGTFDVTDGAEEPAVVAAAVEFLLEGLHLARRINKDRSGAGTVYRR
ncbi:MAG: magnesium chelatase [Candidatus Limnocylindrales bacterium]